jgi:TolA-binding protein
MNELIVLPNPPDTNVGPTKPGPDAPEKARLKRQSWRRFGAAACALALTLGTGWAVGNKFQPREAADSRGDTNAARKLADANEAERGDIRALREEIRALQAKLDSLGKRSDAPETGTLEAQLNSLDRKIEANHADAANVAAQIEARLEKNDKSMGRLEAAISANSSLPAAANKPPAKIAAPAAPAATISVKPPAPATASNDAKGSVKPAARVAPPAATAGGAYGRTVDAAKPIGDYSVREVQDGIALVQGRAGGLYEVGPGDRLPGVGKVLGVERIGQKWVVVTESGRIDGQAPAPQPRYSQRRDPGGYYFDERF